MSDQWTTPWYPGDVKPVRVGVYERKSHTGTFSYWDGKRWGMGAHFARQAANDRDPSAFQREPWRGLTKEAK
jgi:hypothetical protein